MSSFLKVLAGIFGVLYPFLIYIGLRYFNSSPRVLVFLIIMFGTVYFLAFTNERKGSRFQSIRFWVMILLVSLLSLLTYVTENSGYAKLYPVLINIFLLLSFSVTLLKGPSMIFRFAMLQDKSISENPQKAFIEKYCFIVTVIWISFFIINGIIALITVFWAGDKTWALYNGFISYVFMGLIFVIEWIVRKRVAV